MDQQISPAEVDDAMQPCGSQTQWGTLCTGSLAKVTLTKWQPKSKHLNWLLQMTYQPLFGPRYLKGCLRTLDPHPTDTMGALSLRL